MLFAGRRRLRYLRCRELPKTGPSRHPWILHTARKEFPGFRRLDANLPTNLRFADFRRTAMTEIVESGATDDEARAVSRHLDRNVLARYAPPSDAMATNAMTKRTDRRARLKKGAESA
jgi:hypothetical protein